MLLSPGLWVPSGPLQRSASAQHCSFATLFWMHLLGGCLSKPPSHHCHWWLTAFADKQLSWRQWPWVLAKSTLWKHLIFAPLKSFRREDSVASAVQSCPRSSQHWSLFLLPWWWESSLSSEEIPFATFYSCLFFLFCSLSLLIWILRLLF